GLVSLPPELELDGFPVCLALALGAVTHEKSLGGRTLRRLAAPRSKSCPRAGSRGHIVLTPAPRRAMLRATPRGAADGPCESPPVRAGRGRGRAWAAGGVWAAAVADGDGITTESLSTRISQ